MYELEAVFVPIVCERFDMYMYMFCFASGVWTLVWGQLV